MQADVHACTMFNMGAWQLHLALLQARIGVRTAKDLERVTHQVPELV